MNLKYSVWKKEFAELASNFHVSSSSCGNPDHYDNYIRFSSLADQTSGMGVTHVIIDTDAGRLAGYITLRASSVLLPGEGGLQMVNPALEIAELAVDAEYESKGVGSDLVSIAFSVADQLRSNFASVKIIVVCADPDAEGFYEKHKFQYCRNFYEVPRDGWNNNCEAMYIKL